MPINPTTIADNIVLKLPSGWRPNWTNGVPPKEWAEKFALDVQTMWTALTMTPGTGPAPPAPPVPPYQHSHSGLLVVPSSTNMGTLGYSSLAQSMFTAMGTKFATHLQANFATSTVDGIISHTHTISGLAATAATLASSFKLAATGLNIHGAAMPDQGDQNSLDLIFAAFAEGTLGHLEGSGTLALSGPLVGHVHAVS